MIQTILLGRGCSRWVTRCQQKSPKMGNRDKIRGEPAQHHTNSVLTAFFFYYEVQVVLLSRQVSTKTGLRNKLFGKFRGILSPCPRPSATIVCLWPHGSRGLPVKVVLVEILRKLWWFEDHPQDRRRIKIDTWCCTHVWLTAVSSVTASSFQAMKT